VVQVKLPPLRDRKSDIPILAESFLHELAKANGKPFKPLSEEALQALLGYSWPGNVRELRTALEHGVVMCNTPRVGVKHLPGYLLQHRAGVPGNSHAAMDGAAVSDGAAVGGLSVGGDLNLEKMERALIEEALRRTGDNRTEAAEVLGLSRRTLQRKLKEMNRVKKIRRLRD
jgi:two-component system response regulator AtoC